MRSRATVQFIGGGFGNGKTAGVCVKGLTLAKDYPSSNGLIARSTYPKLNDTIRKEFLSWTPNEWIQRRPTKDDNTLILKNGSHINFRYVQQQGTKSEQASSNLLSASYDWIIVDQIEDPEFQHKDFMDLIGRLRGLTPYAGKDPTMPRIGPRWMMLTSNPTRNWVYRELIRPLHRFYDPTNPVVDPKLICVVDDDGKPVLRDGKPIPVIELFEGATTENVHNVGEDYVRNMLSTYTGAMRDRYIYGKWGALSGLVYPSFDESVHVLQRADVDRYIKEMRRSGFEPTWIEGYDHGLIVPSCYLLGFADDDNNVFYIDGFYRKEQTIEQSAALIHEIRAKYGIEYVENDILADPDLFRRKATNAAVVGTTVADLFHEQGIALRRADAGISSGTAKVTQYLGLDIKHEHPITGQLGSPHLYVADDVDFLINEFSEYYWQSNTSGDLIDKPVDRNDHAMDAMKYSLTYRPRLATYKGRPDAPPKWMAWHEVETQARKVLPRHK